MRKLEIGEEVKIKMASDTLLLWLGALFVEWFFLARRHGDNEDERRIGKENLGWFFIFLTSWIGIGLIDSGESASAFIFGGIGMIVSIIKLTGNVNED